MKGNWILKNKQHVRQYKKFASAGYLKAKYPHNEYETVPKPPGITKLERYMDRGICPCCGPCDCMIEPDGHCEHGYPSWLLALSVI